MATLAGDLDGWPWLDVPQHHGGGVVLLQLPEGGT